MLATRIFQLSSSPSSHDHTSTNTASPSCLISLALLFAVLLCIILILNLNMAYPITPMTQPTMNPDPSCTVAGWLPMTSIEPVFSAEPLILLLPRLALSSSSGLPDKDTTLSPVEAVLAKAGQRRDNSVIKAIRPGTCERGSGASGLTIFRECSCRLSTSILYFNGPRFRLIRGWFDPSGIQTRRCHYFQHHNRTEFQLS